MIWLSVCDGISCGRIAAERSGLPVTQYYASEVDKYAIGVTKRNYPDTKHIGDIRLIYLTQEDINLLAMHGRLMWLLISLQHLKII